MIFRWCKVSTPSKYTDRTVAKSLFLALKDSINSGIFFYARISRDLKLLHHINTGCLYISYPRIGSASE